MRVCNADTGHGFGEIIRNFIYVGRPVIEIEYLPSASDLTHACLDYYLIVVAQYVCLDSPPVEGRLFQNRDIPYT